MMYDLTLNSITKKDTWVWSFDKGRWSTRHESDPLIKEGDPLTTPSTHISKWDIKLKSDDDYQPMSSCLKRKFEGGTKVNKKVKSKIKVKVKESNERHKTLKHCETYHASCLWVLIHHTYALLCHEICYVML